jgi:CubicO group peptidase (beta-lactamase class C family)
MMIGENWVNFLFSKPVTQEPGLVFNYNSGCSHLLLAVLYKSGLDVADFAQKHLFTPLGISNDQYRWTQVQMVC